MRRWVKIAIVMFVLAWVTAAFSVASSQEATPAVTPMAGQYGENYNADPALLIKALGTTDNVPDIALAAFTRAGLPVSDAMVQKALDCWKNNVCDTGSGGKLTLAIADGFGENVWRQITHMETILQALTYPDIGKIMYSSAQYDTQKAISDIRSYIAQGVNIIVGYPDAGDALLPAVREATQHGITYIPYSYGKIGDPGTDYPTFVGEDVCALGQNFAAILNREVGTGKVAFLGGTPGNPLSAAWQDCEQKALNPSLTLVGKADTMWTQEGALQAVSGLISSDPDIKGISYEYADGFLGGVRAYQAANIPLNIVLTLRTDEVGLFCQWKDMANPNFKIYYSAGGNFQARIAVTAAMMQIAGDVLPSSIIVPSHMRQVDASTCNPDVPTQYPVSSLVPINIVKDMYPAGS